TSPRRVGARSGPDRSAGTSSDAVRRPEEASAAAAATAEIVASRAGEAEDLAGTRGQLLDHGDTSFAGPGLPGLCLTERLTPASPPLRRLTRSLVLAEEQRPRQHDEQDQHDPQPEQPGGVDRQRVLCVGLLVFLLLLLLLPFLLVVLVMLLLVVHGW